MKAIQLTERDISILKFINEFGFCEIAQLSQRFAWKKPRNYQIMQRLVQAGLVKHERIFYGKHGIYRLSQKGAEYTDLPPLARVPLHQYRHELLLIRLHFKLMHLYPEAQFISERRLKRDKFFDGVGKQGHVSDGILILPDHKKVAIELELSLKGMRRIEHIIKEYGTQFDIQEVWYYCAEKVMTPLRKVAANQPFIKVHSLKEFLT